MKPTVLITYTTLVRKREKDKERGFSLFLYRLLSHQCRISNEYCWFHHLAHSRASARTQIRKSVQYINYNTKNRHVNGKRRCQGDTQTWLPAFAAIYYNNKNTLTLRHRRRTNMSNISPSGLFKSSWVPRNVWSGVSGKGNPNMKLDLV